MTKGAEEAGGASGAMWDAAGVAMAARAGDGESVAGATRGAVGAMTEEGWPQARRWRRGWPQAPR